MNLSFIVADFVTGFKVMAIKVLRFGDPGSEFWQLYKKFDGGVTFGSSFAS